MGGQSTPAVEGVSLHSCARLWGAHAHHSLGARERGAGAGHPGGAPPAACLSPPASAVASRRPPSHFRAWQRRPPQPRERRASLSVPLITKHDYIIKPVLEADGLG